MQNRRWWGLGLMGIALAGTIALVIPSEAQTGAMLARNDFGSAARQPDRAVQQEAQAIANRIEEGMRRSASLLQTLADGDMAVFDRDRVALNAASSQWPIALFTATPGKGSEFSVQPPGERYLSPEDVESVQKQGVWIAERAPLKSVLVAVPSRTGQVLASRVPFSYFTQGLNAIPRANGVRRYLLDASGKPVDRDVAPNGEDRDWCQQLLELGEGFLSTSDAMFSVARIPSTGWAVVVRHPIGNTAPVVTFDAGTLGGPTMIASGPMQAPGLPKGILLYPLAGVALLFGLGIVGWKQRWPGLEDGPIAFGEHALKSVTGPIRDRFERRTPPPQSLPPSSEVGLATFAAEVPSKLPAAIAGDVDFLRTEQVRNLRELWSHTEERLSGQRNWVREEVRRVQDSTTTSVAELGSIVNLAEQRLEDARSAWSEVQASLLARIDEARTGLVSEQELHAEFRGNIEDQLADLRGALAAEQEAREEQGKRLARGLGDLASGLEAENAERSRQDEQLAGDLAQRRADLEALIEAERQALEADLAGKHESQQALNVRMERDLEALSTLMNEEFARLDEALQASRALISELDAREADARSQWQAAVAAQTERSDRLADDLVQAREELDTREAEARSQWQMAMAEHSERSDRLADDLTQAREELASELADQAQRLQGLVADAQAQLGTEMAAIADRTQQLGDTLGALETRLSANRTSVNEQLTELETLVQEALPPLRQELEALRGLSGSVEQISHRLDAHGERFEGLAALEKRLLDLGKRMDKRFKELDATRRSVDERVEAANARVLQQADELEEANERLYGLSDELDQVTERLDGTQQDVETLKGTLDTRLNDQQNALTQIRAQHQDLDRLVEKLEDQALKRLETTESKLTELSSKVLDHDRLQGDLKSLPSDLSGLKGRLEGMSLAHARQQEALNTAMQQIVGLQQAFDTQASDSGMRDQVEELTRYVQQLAEQSQLLAQALDATTAAASRSEGWVSEQLSLIRSEQAEAVAAMAQENATLRESLHTLKESNEALSNRMHMVVQVLSKISK